MPSDILVVSLRDRVRTKLTQILGSEPSFIPRWPWEPLPPPGSRPPSVRVAVVDVEAIFPHPRDVVAASLRATGLGVVLVGYLEDDGAILRAVTRGIPVYPLDDLSVPSIAALTGSTGSARDPCALIRRVCGDRVRQFLARIDRAPVLARRDVQILALLAGGYRNKEIGSALGITEKTVKNRLTAIFEALGVAGRHQASAWYREHHGESGQAASTER